MNERNVIEQLSFAKSEEAVMADGIRVMADEEADAFFVAVPGDRSTRRCRYVDDVMVALCEIREARA